MRLYLTADRYYAVMTQRDLFGHDCLVLAFGGRWSRRGRVLTVPYSDEALSEIDKRRRAHGYVLS